MRGYIKVLLGVALSAGLLWLSAEAIGQRFGGGRGGGGGGAAAGVRAGGGGGAPWPGRRRFSGRACNRRRSIAAREWAVWRDHLRRPPGRGRHRSARRGRRRRQPRRFRHGARRFHDHGWLEGRRLHRPAGGSRSAGPGAAA